MKVGDTYALAIPDPVDPDGDGITIKSVTFSPTPAFIAGTYPTYSLQPSVTSDIGTYKCTISVTDTNPSPLSATYSFNIKVTAAAAANDTSNFTVNTNVTVKNNTTSNVVNTTSDSFTASIKSISI